jgi:nitrate/nitrite-specific signal transduction histidine kinase
MPEDTTREQTERGELERAFDTFNLLSSQLQQTYHALEQRVATTSSARRFSRRESIACATSSG